MSTPDIRATAIANEVYPMLVECATSSGIAVADRIRELQAKLQLVDVRAAMVGEKQAGVAN